MQRSILFRGKRVYDLEWVYGYLSDINTINSIVIDTSTGFSTTDEYSVVPDTVGQFTGLKDKNGKEIFEGDIIGFFTSKSKGHSKDGIQAFYTIVWDKVCFHGDVLYTTTGFLAKSSKSDSLMSIEYLTKYMDAIVVGTIFDTPIAEDKTIQP